MALALFPSPIDDADDVHVEYMRAARSLKRWSDDPNAKGAPSGAIKGAFAERDLNTVRRLAIAHRKRMKQIHLGPSLSSRRLRMNKLMATVEARILALLWASEKLRQPRSLQKIRGQAASFDVRTTLVEPVLVRPEIKPDGRLRIISMDGLLRTAQRKLLRDGLSMMGIDNDLDTSRKGGGGERRFVGNVTERFLNDGFHHWWTPDVRSCFQSLTPKHLRAVLPIDRKLMRHVVFLPKVADIKVRLNKGQCPAIAKALRQTYPDVHVSDEATPQVLIPLIEQMVRQGLPTGSVVSPLVARAFVGQELRAMLEEVKVAVGWSHVDDLAVGARLPEEAHQAKQALTKRLQSHPAGPISLHDVDVRAMLSGRVRLLGYGLVPEWKDGERRVHVVPKRKRTDRFKLRLHKRLLSAAPEQRMQVGFTYQRHWFRSQHAWTKVPYFSQQASEDITLTYIFDFEDGIPMGAWSVNKPPLG